MKKIQTNKQIAAIFLGPSCKQSDKSGVGKTCIISQLIKGEPHIQYSYFMDDFKQKQQIVYKYELGDLNDKILFHLYDTGGIEELKWTRDFAYKSKIKHKVGIFVFDVSRCEEFVQIQNQFIPQWKQNVQPQNKNSIIVIGNCQDKESQWKGKRLEGLRNIYISKCKQLKVLFLDCISNLGPDIYINMQYILKTAYILKMNEKGQQQGIKKYIQKNLQRYTEISSRYKEWSIGKEQKIIRQKWSKQLGIKMIVIRNNFQKAIKKLVTCLKHFCQVMNQNLVQKQCMRELNTSLCQLEGIKQFLSNHLEMITSSISTNNEQQIINNPQDKQLRQKIQKIQSQIAYKKVQKTFKYLGLSQKLRQQKQQLQKIEKQIKVYLQKIINQSQESNFIKNIKKMKEDMQIQSTEQEDQMKYISNIQVNNQLNQQIQSIIKDSQQLQLINSFCSEIQQLLSQFCVLFQSRAEEATILKSTPVIGLSQLMLKLINYYTQSKIPSINRLNINKKSQIEEFIKKQQKNIQSMQYNFSSKITQLISQIMKSLQQLKSHDKYLEYVTNKLDVIQHNDTILRKIKKYNKI